MLMTTGLERGKNNITAQKLDPKEIVTLDELANSNIFQIETILRLLVKKDTIIKQEYVDEMKELKREIAEKGTVEW